MTTQFETDIEDLLRERFPLMAVIDAIAPVAASLAAKPAPGLPPAEDMVARRKAEIDRARQQYRAMPALHVSQLAAASRQRQQQQDAKRAAEQGARAEAAKGAKDATRFYNQPGAAADFTFWCKVDYWTADEAAALLLGCDPRSVNPTTLEQELLKGTGLLGLGDRPARSKFHDSFDGLRTLLSRAEALSAPKIRPASVRAWAQRTQTAIPAGLAAALSDVDPSAGGDLQGELGPLTPAATDTCDVQVSPTKWTPEMLAELRAFRDKHSTKAAAEKYGISPSPATAARHIGEGRHGPAVQRVHEPHPIGRTYRVLSIHRHDWFPYVRDGRLIPACGFRSGIGAVMGAACLYLPVRASQRRSHTARRSHRK